MQPQLKLLATGPLCNWWIYRAVCFLFTYFFLIILTYTAASEHTWLPKQAQPTNLLVINHWSSPVNLDNMVQYHHCTSYKPFTGVPLFLVLFLFLFLLMTGHWTWQAASTMQYTWHQHWHVTLTLTLILFLDIDIDMTMTVTTTSTSTLMSTCHPHPHPYLHSPTLPFPHYSHTHPHLMMMMTQQPCVVLTLMVITHCDDSIDNVDQDCDDVNTMSTCRTHIHSSLFLIVPTLTLVSQWPGNNDDDKTTNDINTTIPVHSPCPCPQCDNDNDIDDVDMTTMSVCLPCPCPHPHPWHNNVNIDNNIDAINDVDAMTTPICPPHTLPDPQIHTCSIVDSNNIYFFYLKV